MKQILYFAVSLLLAVNISSYSQVKPVLTSKQLGRLDSLATQDVPKGAPGIASAIIKNGEVIFEKYAGYANLDDSLLITEKTRFNIASNGKQFTALAILLLADNKKLKLSDDIRIYFPELYPLVKSKITINNLLNHTSGIRDFYDLLSLQGITWWEKDYNNSDVLELIKKQQDLNFEPGSKYLYSNTNYILLALIIEKASSEPFVSFTNKMFKMLNMVNTSFEDNALSIKGPIAKSYFNFNTWTTYDWKWNVCGDGNIFSTLEDQIQWELLVQGKGHAGIKRKIIELSQKPIAGSIKNYGYGLEFSEYKGLHYQFHEGATGAWKATFLRFPDQKASFLTLTNSGKTIPSQQTRQMVDALLKLHADDNFFITKPSKIGPYVSENDIVGVYLTDNNFSFQFELNGNALFLKRVGRNDVELVRESENVFHQKFDPDFKQEFLKNKNGVLEVTAYYINHQPYTLKKVLNDWEGFKFGSTNGNFVNLETNTTIQINHLDGFNYEVVFNNSYKTKGLLVTTTKMLVDFYTIEFEKNQLFLNGERIKKVKFEPKN